MRTSECLWQYYRNGLALNNAGAIIDFTGASNNSVLFIFRQGITGQAGNDGTKDVEIMVPLKYLNHFWRTCEMSLISCEINVILIWSAIDGQVATFAITNTKHYVAVVTLSTRDNAKLLQQLKSAFTSGLNINQNGIKWNYISIKWNKYQSKPTIHTRNQY